MKPIYIVAESYNIKGIFFDESAASALCFERLKDESNHLGTDLYRIDTEVTSMGNVLDDLNPILKWNVYGRVVRNRTGKGVYV